jgi:RNA polymerase sigma factor (sigma-70 family)
VNELRRVTQNPWLRRLQSGAPDREQAIEELRAYLVRGLDRSLRHRYGGKVQVEDIVQVALLKILNSLDTFQQRSRFETWAMAIAIRVGMSELRKRYYRDVSLDLSLNGDNIRIEVVDRASDAVKDHAGAQVLLALLQRLIDDRLSDKQRLAIRGSLEGLPVEEIAARMASNRNAVYKLVHDAKLKLRQALEADGFTAEDILELIA